MQKIALFPGSFDPFTKGHEDIVLRGLGLFDTIIIAIGYNEQKGVRYFSIQATIEGVKNIFSHQPAVQVVTYAELTAGFAKKNGACYLLRGLRNTTDFEYENSVAQANKYLNDELESVFLITAPRFASINSSVVREIHRYGGDISAFVPYSPG